MRVKKIFVFVAVLALVPAFWTGAAQDPRNWATEITPENQEIILREAKLYLSKLFAKSKSLSLFLRDIKGESQVSGANLDFKMIADELLIGEGAVLKMREGKLYFYLDSRWWLLKDRQKAKQAEALLLTIRKEHRREVWAMKRSEPGVVFSTVEGSVEKDEIGVHQADIQMLGTATGMEPTLRLDMKRKN
jgi:hypothetical protein